MIQHWRHGSRGRLGKEKVAPIDLLLSLSTWKGANDVDKTPGLACPNLLTLPGQSNCVDGREQIGTMYQIWRDHTVPGFQGGNLLTCGRAVVLLCYCAIDSRIHVFCALLQLLALLYYLRCLPPSSVLTPDPEQQSVTAVCDRSLTWIKPLIGHLGSTGLTGALLGFGDPSALSGHPYQG